MNKLPHVRTLNAEYQKYKSLYPPGHFYSPIHSNEEIIKRQKKIFCNKEKVLNDIDLNEEKQINLLNELKNYYGEIPFTNEPNNTMRYFFMNNFFSYADAIILFCIMRHFEPQNMIEIGSGYSSALMLDTNEKFFDNRIHLSFIEPHPERLHSLIKAKDSINHEIINSCAQDVDVVFFKKLKTNDVLFVDSSHVSKAGSDLNYILFEILPQLNSGVLIHFHDIFYPFEYPKDWILNGRAWNECYLLRAFLQCNNRYEVLLFNTFLEQFHKEWIQQNMPVFLQKTCLPNSLIKECSSLWLKKV